ncbi:hypothetical protein [Nocardia nova]|nr:hypothetical protein [Nocardia nova]
MKPATADTTVSHAITDAATHEDKLAYQQIAEAVAGGEGVARRRS